MVSVRDPDKKIGPMSVFRRVIGTHTREFLTVNHETEPELYTRALTSRPDPRTDGPHWVSVPTKGPGLISVGVTRAVSLQVPLTPSLHPDIPINSPGSAPVHKYDGRSHVQLTNH